MLHHVTMAGGNAASSLESFTGSEDLEALRHVLERTLKPGPVEDTVARGASRPTASLEPGNGRVKPRDATHVNFESDDASQGTVIYDGVTGGSPTFEILRPLARGGLGEVFVAKDGRLNREVALKLIEGSQAADGQSRARFLLEAEITGGLEHPGIVPIYALGENADGRLFYAMRLVRGETLKERIRKFHNAGSISRQAVAFRQMLNHFVRICDIVAYAHSRGVLHRDLKPSNVMLGKFGETLVVDWGLAKPIDRLVEGRPSVHDELTLRPVSGSSVQATLHGATLGTPQYMSPEQATRAARAHRPGERRLRLRRDLVLHFDRWTALARDQRRRRSAGPRGAGRHRLAAEREGRRAAHARGDLPQGHVGAPGGSLSVGAGAGGGYRELAGRRAGARRARAPGRADWAPGSESTAPFCV